MIPSIVAGSFSRFAAVVDSVLLQWEGTHMQCPACRYSAAQSDFGEPACCPKCGAYYEKALVARATINNLQADREVQRERARRVSSIRSWVFRGIAATVRWFAGLMNSQQLRRPLVVSTMFIVLTGLGVYALDKSQSSRPPAPARAASNDEKSSEIWAINYIGKSAVLSRLKDPDSAKFRDQFVGKQGVACGEVNSRTSFGGYGGYQRYIASGGGLVFFEEDMDGAEFRKTWTENCR